jgi:hypothetical protein
VTLHTVIIRDSFGDEWKVTPPANWSLFAVTGLAETSLLFWPTVSTPLSGPVLEAVVLGIDEDSNLLWAVEQRYMLARGTDGMPVLWSQRRRLPLLSPPAPHLRFDVMQEEIHGF